jgi:hypothetical protein
MPHALTFLITDLHVGGTPRMLATLARGLVAEGRFGPAVVCLAPLPPAPAPIVDELRAAGIRVESQGV